MIVKGSQQLKARYYGEIPIKAIYYRGTKTWPEASELEVTPTEVTILASGGETTINVKSNVQWTITIN